MSFINRESIIYECKQITMQRKFYDINVIQEQYKHGIINRDIAIKVFTAFCKAVNMKRLNNTLQNNELKVAAIMIYETIIK